MSKPLLNLMYEEIVPVLKRQVAIFDISALAYVVPRELSEIVKLPKQEKQEYK